MNKTIAGIILTLLLVSMFAAAFNIHSAKAEPGTIYIRADGSIDPSTANITSADNTTYSFTDNNYLEYGEIRVERDNIVIDGKGHILSVGYSDFGINQYDRNNVTIKNMKIEGVWLWAGIHLMRSSNCTISGNNIKADAPTQPEGIYLENSSNSKIVDNAFINDGLFVVFSYQNTVENNTINGKPLVYLEGVSDHTINDAGQVILVRCNNVTVKDLDVHNTTAGVELFETNSTTISGNNMAENNLGIALEGSSNNIIDKNNMAENLVGIWLESNRAHESSNNTVSGNHIAGGGHLGVAGRSNTGINLRYSNYNSISGNNITNNRDGIIFEWSSSYSCVYENNITENYYGIDAFGSGDGLDYSNNTFYHNNIVNNSWQAFAPNSMNVWDNGVEGNYWSNYTGVDSDYDGIGDAVHEIDANNVDHYPLMSMFRGFDTLYDYQIDIVSNSSISFFNFSVVGPYQAMLTFNITGDMGTQGFCRICIPKDLINSSYVVKLNGEVITEPQVRQLLCSNETYEYLYINYTHSEHTVEISGTTVIPEFPSLLILPILMVLSIFAVILARKHTLKH